MESKSCLRLWLEVGHACEPRVVSLGQSKVLDWRVWVRGVAGADISTFVHKVVFHLSPDYLFTHPKKVFMQPPYEIKECGFAPLEIPIDIYLKFTSEPKKIQLKYSFSVADSSRCTAESRCIYYDIENPPKQLRQSLMTGRGQFIAQNGAQGPRCSLVVLSDSKEDRHSHHKTSTQKKRKLNESLQEKPLYKKTKLFAGSSKCDDSRLGFTSSLRRVSMSKDEINTVRQLYLAHSSYEKSGDGLQLPPLSDPIYCMPELPASLRDALKSSEPDYVLQ